MEQPQRSEGVRPLSLHEALAYVHAKNIEVRRTGRVDSEPSDFRIIENDLTSGAITPQEAIARTDALIASRQDYN